MSRDATSEPQPFGLRAWQQVLVFFAACLAVASRIPDAVWHAQFWAEDGHVFFADAYNQGWWRALFSAYNGYFHAVPRLAAALALAVPLQQAPLVMNLIAILIAALPVSLLFSARSAAWGSIGFRALLATSYIALPDMMVIRHGITESQFLLALGAFLLVVARPAQSHLGRAFDVVFLLLAGLSGPACIFLLPIAVIVAVKRAGNWRWAPVITLALCVAVQAYGLLILNASGRPHFALGARPDMFIRIFGGNVVFGALLGPNRLAVVPGLTMAAVLFCLTAGGIAFATSCYLLANIEMRLFLAFAAMILGASLLSPTVYPFSEPTAWDFLARAAEIRYWSLPSLAFVWSVLWCARRGNNPLKVISAVLLVVMVFSIAMFWRQKPFVDLQFGDYAKRFEAAPAGTVMTIPENPVGWKMRLVKHDAR
jgi:hypothetical protein